MQIRWVVESCSQVLIEFSARDPWCYGGLTGADDLLLSAWRELVLEYSDCFLNGIDPVWKVTRTQTWDQADDGWDYSTAHEQVYRLNKSVPIFHFKMALFF